MSQAPLRTAEVTALSVHGPRGVLDLTVPSSAPLAEVARAYARQAGLDRVLPLVTRSGQRLAPDTTVDAAGLTAGSVLVAVDLSVPADAGAALGGSGRRTTSARVPGLQPSALSGLWCALAAAVALLAGWSTAQQPPDERTLPAVVLAAAALLGSLPVGPLSPHRIVAAPAFAAAACFALLWDPAPERLPTIVGAAALAGAVTAALGRALNTHAEEPLRVWLVVGAAWFTLAGLAALVSLAPQGVWAVLFLLAVLAARFVPALAIDLPDQYLIDLQRLAVTAWSARERPTGRRGRIVVPPEVVAAVAVRGTRVITASAVAILAVVTLAGPLLLVTADLPLDRVGARCLVFFGGAALLLAARSYRHAAARRMLRIAGVLCLAAVAYVLLEVLGGQSLAMATGAVLAVAALVLLVAVAVGRGWRSAWWSRRAEVAESLCGAFAVGSLVVAVGFFRHMWEITG